MCEDLVSAVHLGVKCLVRSQHHSLRTMCTHLLMYIYHEAWLWLYVEAVLVPIVATDQIIKSRGS